LQQATNFQEAHNDNRKTIAFADGLWVMFDYNRGYAPDVEASGCTDLFRLPKFSRAFFRSQRPPQEHLHGADSGAMAFIASYWMPDSSPTVRVFSNCEEVELILNGMRVERRRPDVHRMSTHLAHPPFTFDVGRYRPGTLEAVGYIAGQAVAHHAVRTPGAVEQMELRLDEGGRPFAVDGKDVAFLHGELRDGNGTLVPDAWENVSFGAIGDVQLVGRNPFSSDAGVATILVQTDLRHPRAAVYALAVVRDGERVRVLSGAVPVGGDTEPWEIRVTTDGSEPVAAAPRYDVPILASGRVRAVLFVRSERLVEADTDTPKFRIPGSTAPA
jgi:beta-galactosidase